MYLQDNTSRLFVVDGSKNITTSRKGKYLSDLAVGEIAVVSLSGKIIDKNDVGNHSKFKIGYKQTDGLVTVSDVIDARSLGDFSGVLAKAATNHTMTIGYNGTSGALDNSLEDDIYILTLSMTDGTGPGDQERIKRYAVHKVAAAQTQLQVCEGLIDNLYDNFKYETDWKVKGELLCSAVRAAVVISTDTIRFVKGSKYAHYTAVVGGLSVGDMLSIGATANLAAATYRITAIDTTNKVITLFNEYVGENATLGSTAVSYIESANLATANFGIKITAIDKKFVVGAFKYVKTRFDILPSGFGTTPVKVLAYGSIGLGEWESIAEIENFVQGEDGGEAIYRVNPDGPPRIPRQEVVKDGIYNLLSFKFYDALKEFIGTVNVSHKRLLIAIKTANYNTTAAGTSINGVDSSLVDVLEAYMTAYNVGGSINV